MQTNLLWTGREYYSLENCLVNVNNKGADIRSSIVGKYQEIIYRVEYHIITNPEWQTIFTSVKSQHSNKLEEYRFESDGKGNWSMNSETAPVFNGCIDVDIPLTPFTNTLPINRLKLHKGMNEQISVIYIDLLAGEIKPVKQQYTRLSDTSYHYENVPNDFEADIIVDESGFVVDYPELFVRTAALKSEYPLQP